MLNFTARTHISGGFCMCCAYTDYEKPVFSNGSGDEELSHRAVKASHGMQDKDASEQQLFRLA